MFKHAGAQLECCATAVRNLNIHNLPDPVLPHRSAELLADDSHKLDGAMRLGRDGPERLCLCMDSTYLVKALRPFKQGDEKGFVGGAYRAELDESWIQMPAEDTTLDTSKVVRTKEVLECLACDPAHGPLCPSAMYLLQPSMQIVCWNWLVSSCKALGGK